MIRNIIPSLTFIMPFMVWAADSTGRGGATGQTFQGTVYRSVGTCSGRNIQGLLTCVGQIFERLIPLTVALALLYFLWGAFKIIRAQGDTSKIEEGRRTAIWGIVALFVMVSIGGIIAFIYGDFLGGISNTVPSTR